MAELAAGQVECHSGHTYAQEPRAVIWHDRRYPVAAVAVRWRTPQGPVFWVETETGERFELQYIEGTGTWCIQPLPADDGPPLQAGNSSTEVYNDDKEVPAR
jgi:hypothetical protein